MYVSQSVNQPIRIASSLSMIGRLLGTFVIRLRHLEQADTVMREGAALRESTQVFASTWSRV